MGTFIAGVLVFGFFYSTVAMFVWIAIRTWRDPDRFGSTARILGRRFGDSVGEGLARGVAVAVGGYVCVACFIAAGFAGMASTSPGVWKWVAGVFMAGFLASVPLLAVIVVFNRPRFLVVPYMRHLDRAAIRGGSPSLRERLSQLRRAGRSDSPE